MPINHISRDRKDELSRITASAGVGWKFANDTREDSYKKPRLRLDIPHLDAIALRGPVEKRWYGFPTRAMTFFLIADSPRYIAPSPRSCDATRPISRLPRRLFPPAISARRFHLL